MIIAEYSQTALLVTKRFKLVFLVMQNLHSCRAILNLVRIMILRNVIEVPNASMFDDQTGGKLWER